MNERKAAQDSIAAYKDMQTNFEAEQNRTLNMVTTKDDELEKLRNALAKARDGLGSRRAKLNIRN